MEFNAVAKYDVVIIGSGISGLICALELAKYNKNVLIVTKEAVTESSSQYAQGGVAIPLAKQDSIQQHLVDTLKAGTFLCDSKVANEIVGYSQKALEKLISYGVRFDSMDEGEIHLTREAAHSHPRVCHIGGDATGRYLSKSLIDKVCREPQIAISQGTVALSLIKSLGGNSTGVFVEDVTRDKYVIWAEDVIIASGGLGQLFQYTTNPKVATGDGIAMSYRFGAQLQDIEMIQFHPTVLLQKGDPFLITEAIRGEGGRLKNMNNEYFAMAYHEKGELAPRDILSRAIVSELEKNHSKSIYLDISSIDRNHFKTRFPTVYSVCEERNIDLFGVGIPVSPAAHYSIGGIKCDLYGKTNIDGLWVVGEAASSGFHGANRLASNSLLECIVAPHFLIQSLLDKEKDSEPTKSIAGISIDENLYNETETMTLIRELQNRNNRYLGLVRIEETLNSHLKWLNDISGRFNFELISLDLQAQELKNMVLLSIMICNAAIERKHSLGVHYRKDFQQNPRNFKHSILSKNNQLYWLDEVSNKALISFSE